MHYQLSDSQQKFLLSQPETGMGYQVIKARFPKTHIEDVFLVLNAEIAVEMNHATALLVRQIFTDGFRVSKERAQYFTREIPEVLTDKEQIPFVAEGKPLHKCAAAGRDEHTDGHELFVRVSPYDDDKRIDQGKNSLRPGSFLTSHADYLNCKSKGHDPLNRYALPNSGSLRWTFYVQPKRTDVIRRGTVQAANNRSGGGKEILAVNGTAFGTFLRREAY